VASPRPPRRLRKIVEAAESVGWTYDVTARQHPRLSPPRGMRDSNGDLVAPVTFSATPSDKKADRPSTSALRRAGVPI
jgi:hypothetical protein